MSNLISFLRHLKKSKVSKCINLKNSAMFGNIYFTDYFSLSFLSLILQHNFLSLFCVFLLLVFCIEASSHSLAIALHAYNLNVIKSIAACVRDNVFVHVFLCGWNCVYYCTSKIINYFKNALNLHFYLNINLI